MELKKDEKVEIVAPVKDEIDVLAEELQAKIDAEYRTDGMTFPALPFPSNPERNKNSAIERAAILNPTAGMDMIVDADGTTKQEQINRLQFGKLPGEELENQPKHKVYVQEVGGEKTLVVKAPDEVGVDLVEPQVTIVPKEGSLREEDTPPFVGDTIRVDPILPRGVIPKEDK